MPAADGVEGLIEGELAGDHAAGDLGAEVVGLETFERPGGADLLPGRVGIGQIDVAAALARGVEGKEIGGHGVKVG